MRDLENCIQIINKLEVAPELVIHTGDVSHDASPAEYQSARLLLDQLSMPYFVMPGNRDKRAALLKEFSDQPVELPAQGWVQYSIEQFSTRLLIVDTVCDHSNKGQLCADRLEHLQSMLDANTSKPVALFLHHPPYEATGIPDPWQYEDWGDVEKLSALLSRYSNICAMYCGHVHRFIDGEIAAIPGSAITCLAGDLRKGEVTDEERKQPVLKEITLP